MKTKKNRPHNPRTRGGWISVTITGAPFDRGFAHGAALYKELARVLHRLPFMLQKELKKTLAFCIHFTRENIQPIVITRFPEFYEEIRGISAGAALRGVEISVDILMVWNAYMTLYSFFMNGGGARAPAVQKCSAFIATGAATETGEIIMAHNSHADYVSGQLCNIILCVKPDHGVSFTMQTSAGLICSMTDWFITDAGIIGCETTIQKIKKKPHPLEDPYFCRIRNVMQYSRNLDDCFHYMKTRNMGDYSCAWLFGDTHTGEIARLELGVDTHHIDRTKSGYYVGSNSAIDIVFRLHETGDFQNHDTTTSVGARQLRLEQLIGATYYGALNTTLARRIIADHYDVGASRIKPGARTICKHLEEDGKPRGAYDGKVVSSTMAARGEFWARFGSSCGRRFSVRAFVKKFPKTREFLPYLDDFKSYPWVRVGVGAQ
jgi:hypothetical protein